MLSAIKYHFTLNFIRGGALEWREGYQARPWTHKKHPKYVLLGLKFASLNKYSSGIYTLNHDFFPFFTLKQVIMQ